MSNMTICGGPRVVIGIVDNRSASVCTQPSKYYTTYGLFVL